MLVIVMHRIYQIKAFERHANDEDIKIMQGRTPHLFQSCAIVKYSIDVLNISKPSLYTKVILAISVFNYLCSFRSCNLSSKVLHMSGGTYPQVFDILQCDISSLWALRICSHKSFQLEAMLEIKAVDMHTFAQMVDVANFTIHWESSLEGTELVSSHGNKCATLSGASIPPSIESIAL